MIKHKKKVLIIGGDHHNTLAALRGLAKEGVTIILLIHGNFKSVKEVKISHSKYANQISIVKDDEKSIMKWLIDNSSKDKKIIFSCSDLAAYIADKNYNILKNHYIITGFKDNPGKVSLLMDKYEQKKWANENNFLMAKTWNIKLEKYKEKDIEEVEYPCILKPQISAFGKKSDIKKIYNFKELKENLKKLYQMGYSEILLQKFIEKDYEISACGCIVDEPCKYYGGIIKKIREYPINGGSAAFAQFFYDEKINKYVRSIILKLYEQGYRGMYDIDFLICNNNIYLNEINFRHSGNGYAIIKNGLNIPYICYLDILKETKSINKKLKKPNAYFMDEFKEWRLFKNNEIKLKEMLNDIIKSFAFAIFDMRDVSGTIAFFMSKIRKNKL